MPDIAVWNICNNKCIMCTNDPSFARQECGQYRLKGQILKMEKYLKGKDNVYAKNAGDRSYLNLTGGEPTLHPDFFPLITYFRRRLPGTFISLLSNGRKFCDEEFTKKYLLAAKPPFATVIPVHSSSPEEHDYIAGAAGSFEETVKGIENILKYRKKGQYLDIRYIHHGIGKNRLSNTLNFMLERFPDTRQYSFTVIHFEIEGHSFIDLDKIRLTLTESAADVLKAKPLIDRFRYFELYHYPLCVLDEGLRPLARITLPQEERVYPENICGKCSQRKNCLGLMIDYYKIFGDKELHAL